MNKNKLERRKESQFIRQLRVKLWRHDPHCKYCGIETVLPNDDIVVKGQPVPPHVTTIDHKFSRYNPERNVNEQEYILCCFLCNNYKGQLEEMKIPIEELRRRSKGGVRRGDSQPLIKPEIEIINH